MKRKRWLKSLYLMFVVSIIGALLVACTSKKDSDSVINQKPQTELTEDEPGWKEDTSPITFDWYINFSWFASKWGNDATSKYITEKTGVSL
ncbi:MAG TPA: ABC transporter substrate-binding protein, partial [Bacillaceae bacterium]|nr:ABC transporter substrate-binding protein [Bacillaceae bacterium]